MAVASQAEALTMAAPPAQPAQQDSEILIRTTPYARCIIQLENDSDNPNPATITADNTGLVHLWASPTNEKDALVCNENDSAVTHPMDLSDPATFNPPPPVPDSAIIPAPATNRPPLKAPMSLDQAGLIKAGYPPRPNPKQVPELYEKWLRHVSKPGVAIAGRGHEEPDRFENFTTTTNTTWGGFVMDSHIYQQAIGDFIVPTLAAPGGTTQSKAGWWVGLDGQAFGSSTPLIQAGMELKTVGSMKFYRVFYEYYPLGPQFRDDIVPIAPGDEVLIYAWAGDSNGTYWPGYDDSVNNYGWFYIGNVTTGAYLPPARVLKPFTLNGFVGAWAEIIMERPGGTAGQWLANYGLFHPAWFGALDDTYTYRNFTTDHYWIWNLVNGASQNMQSVFRVQSSQTQVDFSWLRSL